MDPIYVIIANKHRRIQMQCPKGYELGESCILKFRTCMMICMDITQFRCIYWPRGICSRHKKNNECRIFDYVDESRKGVPGTGDEFLNLPKIIRGIRWPQCRNVKNSFTQFKARYKFTLGCYQDFLTTIIVNSYVIMLFNLINLNNIFFKLFYIAQSLTEWRNATASRYSNKIRTFLYENNDVRFHHYPNKTLKDTCLLILNKTCLRGILFQYVYGFLYPALNKFDHIRYRYPIKYYTFDACEGDIKSKQGYKKERRTPTLDMSTFRVCGKWCMWWGPVKWLPKCGESYTKIFEEHLGGTIIAENMLRSIEIGEIMNPFIASDVGSESNPDNVRYALVSGIMNRYNMSLEEYEWTSPITGNTFDLRDFWLEVCFHPIRITLPN